MVFEIYKATNTKSGKGYVGFTGQGLEKRKAKHFRDSRTSRFCFQRAIQKHGFESFTWEILCGFQDEEEAKIAETQMIRRHQTLMPSGYNMTEGGEGGRLCQATIRKLRQSRLGKKHTEKTRRKISEANKGNKRTLGYRHTKESRQKIGESKRGESNPNSKLTELQVLEIYQRAWAGEEKQSVLAKEFGINQSLVSHIKYRQAWKYLLRKAK